MKVVWKAFRELLPLLPGNARSYLWRYVVVSCALSVLDIVAIMLLAIALAPMLSGAEIHIPFLGPLGKDAYVWVMAAVSFLILGKSVLAIGQLWFATRKLATFELEVGRQLFDAYIKAPWTLRLQRNTAQLIRIADVGIANTTSGFLLPLMQFPALVVSFITILVIIVIAQPLTAAVTVGYLGGIMLLLYRIVAGRSVTAGRVSRDYSFKVAALMTEMVQALKEITLRNKAGEVADVVHFNRQHSTRARANLNFLGALPNFVLNAALVGGFIVIGGVGYLSGGLNQAVSSVALFAVAGFRLIPSLTGFQSTITTTTANVPHVHAVMYDIKQSQIHIEGAENLGQGTIEGMPQELGLTGVGFAYPGHEDAPAIHDINLRIPIGSTLAFVGSSGAGKSTMIDVLLGLLVPQVGEIRLDGRPLPEVLGAWRSRVGYVPQEVSLFDGTVAQNVALSWDDEDIDFDRVESALKRAQLWDLMVERPGGVRGRVGERGLALSGGQRQRMGIARALYSDPLILVLDEATSALDSKTESMVMNAIHDLKGEVTIVSVAHRLSTIRNSDVICFMQDGTIAARGTFDELVATVPNFFEQAQLSGLA